jgi:hypothetical protein
MDISADLTELGRTPVAVICAGAKSVLDIPRTLEFLETQVNEGCAVFTIPMLGWHAPCLHFQETQVGIPAVACLLNLQLFACLLNQQLCGDGTAASLRCGTMSTHLVAAQALHHCNCP